MYDYQKLLNPHEKVYFFGGMHWIVMAGSLAMLMIMTYAGLKIDQFLHAQQSYPLAEEFMSGAVAWTWTNFWNWLSFLPWVFIGVGVFWVWADAIRYLSTKVLLTSHRVIVKTGWLMVDIKEVEMEEIKAARIDQMLFGRIFGYGKVYLDARFVSDNTLPLMARPFDMVKILHTIRDHNIGEQDDIAAPIASEDLPFKQAGGEVTNESTADEIPEVQAMQPELHGGKMSEDEKRAMYKKSNYSDPLRFIDQQSKGKPGLTKGEVEQAKPTASNAYKDEDPEEMEPVEFAERNCSDAFPKDTFDVLAKDKEDDCAVITKEKLEKNKEKKAQENGNTPDEAKDKNGDEDKKEEDQTSDTAAGLGLTPEDVEFIQEMRAKAQDDKAA